MDQKLVYAKTPIGDEAVRQRTRVVQRNLRLVLVQVDGKLSAGELSAKIGDTRLVENALRDLEQGGFIAPTSEAVSVWQETKLRAQKLKTLGLPKAGAAAAAGRPAAFADPGMAPSAGSAFSSFGTSGSSSPAGEQEAPPPEMSEPRQHRLRLLPLAGGIAGILLLALLTLLLLFPYERFRPDIEAGLSEILQAPVMVGEIRVSVLPLPVLRLANLQVGSEGEAAIDEVRIPSPWALFGSGVRVLSRVDIAGVRLPADRLLASPLLGVEQGRKTLPLIVRRLVVERMSVSAGTLTLADLKGEVRMREDGRVENASLQKIDRSLRVEAQPSPQGVVLKVEGLGWRLSEDSPLTLDSVQANGLLQRSKLIVQSFDATTLGGVVRGSWLLDWSKGLAMVGDVALERLDCRRVTSVFAPSLWLEGYLGGSLRFRAAGRDWPALWSNVEATLDALVLRGVLNGVDLGEAARRGGGSPVRAGSTKFERLSARLTITGQQVIGRDVAMNSGMFSANGQFVVTRDRAVDSNLIVTMQTSASVLRMPIRVSGTLPNLLAIGGRP